jgi:hypothetical protein
LHPKAPFPEQGRVDDIEKTGRPYFKPVGYIFSAISRDWLDF